MEFMFLCGHHRVLLSGAPSLATSRTPNAWVLDTSEMDCPKWAKDVPCHTTWRAVSVLTDSPEEVTS